jgi:hypothetical protein
MTLVTSLIPWKWCFSAVGMSKCGSAVVGRFSGANINLVYLIMLSPNEQIIKYNDTVINYKLEKNEDGNVPGLC